MADRQRIRVGREVSYFPTDAEAAAVGDGEGTTWPATIAKVNSDGSASLQAVRGDGTDLALVAVAQGQGKGTFGLHGGIAHST
jgi:hypothetical protein